MIAAISSVLLMACSQLLFKASMMRLRKREIRPGLLGVLFYPWVVVALCVNVAAALLWIWALREREISYLYPLLCLNFLLVPLGARAFLAEPVSLRRWVSIAVICSGVLLCLTAK